jgi:hypothetical protein
MGRARRGPRRLRPADLRLAERRRARVGPGPRPPRRRGARHPRRRRADHPAPDGRAHDQRAALPLRRSTRAGAPGGGHVDLPRRDGACLLDRPGVVLGRAERLGTRRGRGRPGPAAAGGAHGVAPDLGDRCGSRSRGVPRRGVPRPTRPASPGRARRDPGPGGTTGRGHRVARSVGGEHLSPPGPADPLPAGGVRGPGTVDDARRSRTNRRGRGSQ